MVFLRSATRLARPASSILSYRAAPRVTSYGASLLRQPSGVRTLTATSKQQGKVLLVLYDGGVHAEQEPQLLGTTENELGLRKWIEEQGHTLVTTSDKEGENSKFDQELVDAEVIITTPFHPGYLTAERLAKAKNLKIAITAGIGSDHVDLNAANKTNGGVTVAEVTGSNVVSVAEHVVMTILTLVRNFVKLSSLRPNLHCILQPHPPTIMDLDCAEQGRRSKRTKLEEDAPVDILTRLPRELATEIFSRLPVSSLVNFMYVCRSWRSLAQDPSIVTHLSSITKNNQCLIFHCDTPIRSELCCVDYNTSPGNIQKVTNLIPTFTSSMPEFDVIASCDGVLCLIDSLFGNKLYLYNPFTNFFRPLPKSVEYPNHQDAVIGFGFLQKTQEFKVVQIVNVNHYKDAPREKGPRSKTLILTSGSSNWRDIGEVAYHFVQCTSQIFVHGRLHWMTQPPKHGRNRSSALVSFDLANEVFEEVPKPSSEALKKYEYHLLVIEGCLSAAFYCKRGKLEIWLMKNYGLKESWIKKFSIGKHVPKGLKENELDRDLKILRILARAKAVRVVCVLNNGEILLLYKGKALATYKPTKRKFQDIKIQGTPKWFQVVHAGSFNWINTFLHNRS